MQQALILEDLDDALRELVAHLGGHKDVGHTLRPELSPDRAAQWLRDCINPDRREHLQPEHLMRLLKLGRQAGAHVLIEWIAREAGYHVQPVNQEDEAMRLKRELIQAAAVIKTASVRLEAMGLKL